MVNYLALLGWAYDDSQTIFSREELIEKFSLEKCSKNPAVFDMKKLEWMNGVYLRQLTAAELTDRAIPLLIEAGLITQEQAKDQRDHIEAVVASLQTRLKSLVDVVDSSRYFFQSEITYDEKAVRKFLGRPYAVRLFNLLVETLEPLEDWTENSLEEVFKEIQGKLDEKLGNILQPLRVATTGGTVSPGMYEVLELLGKETSLRRIKDWLKMAKELAQEAE